MNVKQAILIGLLPAVALMPACNGRATRGISPSAAPSAMRTPVGPIPGPNRTVVRPPNPYAADRAAMIDGRNLFNRPSLRDVDWIYGDTDAQILSTIAEGRAHGMPSWGTKMTDDQIWKLVAYIKSMRMPIEPEAPQP